LLGGGLRLCCHFGSLFTLGFYISEDFVALFSSNTPAKETQKGAGLLLDSGFNLIDILALKVRLFFEGIHCFFSTLSLSGSDLAHVFLFQIFSNSGVTEKFKLNLAPVIIGLVDHVVEYNT
jgi:hypothetical protein